MSSAKGNSVAKKKKKKVPTRQKTLGIEEQLKKLRDERARTLAEAGGKASSSKRGDGEQQQQFDDDIYGSSGPTKGAFVSDLVPSLCSYCVLLITRLTSSQWTGTARTPTSRRL